MGGLHGQNERVLQRIDLLDIVHGDVSISIPKKTMTSMISFALWLFRVSSVIFCSRMLTEQSPRSWGLPSCWHPCQIATTRGEPFQRSVELSLASTPPCAGGWSRFCFQQLVCWYPSCWWFPWKKITIYDSLGPEERKSPLSASFAIEIQLTSNEHCSS